MKLFLILFFLCPVIADSQSLISFANPPSTPELLAEGIISTSRKERDFALSPDGTEIFYTIQSPVQGVFQTILYRKKNLQGQWSEPVIAPFAGNYSDLEPVFTADGSKIFFSSNRPESGTEPKDFDLWFVEKKNGVWGDPKNIGAAVNTIADEYYPSIANNGNLYFTAAYKNAIGKEDIFISRWIDNKYTTPEPLDTAVNSKTYEFNAFVSPDESFIIFTSYGRKDDLGGGDLYMSTKDNNGKWKPAFICP
jgi:Tol biopolymer transport system component